MKSRVFGFLATAWAVALIVPAFASAATFTVNTTDDGAAVPADCMAGSMNPCSFRDAAGAATASADAADSIEIPAGHYTFTAGQVSLGGTSTGTITLDGVGARTTTLDAGGLTRVLALSSASFVINDLTITGGLANMTASDFPGDGGGILAVGLGAPPPPSITLNRVSLAGNTATLNGGGIAAPPENTSLGAPRTALTFNDSTVSANKVTGGAAEGGGGGIYLFGSLTANNSTIAGNSVSNPGANQGGGIVAALNPADTAGSTVSLTNTTIAGNSVSAGQTGGGIGITNPTAGVATTVTATNTIVAGNLAGTAPSDCAAVAMVTSVNNLSSDASCMFTDSGSKVSTDPLLGPLQDNGGQTDTLALQAGSPAIDAGTATGCPAADQRGTARPQGATCDIGAFERVPDPPPTDADLSISAKAKPKQVKPDHKITYKLKVTNLGPAIATGVVVKGKAPRSASKIATPGDCMLKKAKRTKRKFICQLGDLAAGGTAKLKIKARAVDGIRKFGTVARVSSSATDLVKANNKVKAIVRAKAK